MRVWMRRRSSSIFVSPGPREPMPAPAPPTWPPAWRDIDSPQPRSRGSRYSSCASSTCALPSRLLACWLKMSRMTAVRSMTLTFTTSSSARRWLGASSVSAITVSAPSAATTCRSSSALPLPRYVLGSGCGRRCRSPSSTRAPAVSARAASSRIEFSASSCEPCEYTPMSTTFSSRSCRYSTSVTSSSSVESPLDAAERRALLAVVLLAVGRGAACGIRLLALDRRSVAGAEPGDARLRLRAAQHPLDGVVCCGVFGFVHPVNPTSLRVR